MVNDQAFIGPMIIFLVKNAKPFVHCRRRVVSIWLLLALFLCRLIFCVCGFVKFICNLILFWQIKLFSNLISFSPTDQIDLPKCVRLDHSEPFPFVTSNIEVWYCRWYLWPHHHWITGWAWMEGTHWDSHWVESIAHKICWWSCHAGEERHCSSWKVFVIEVTPIPV